ncbi:hypothetical protein B0H16DRAFT_1704396 [Mycena metata]|uniref:Uncharacterized protein n=1 Tax=Mycena metata TaxID=1033252 RepID=A0AAD7GW82_9AGAR|nr:hypothetical protein B0H16DRAFT_1704396 [Mycena metata]
MGPSPPSRLFQALTLFFTLTHATSSSPPRPPSPAPPPPTPASQPTTPAPSPPALPTPAVLTNPIPINLLNSGTSGLGVKQKGSFLGFIAMGEIFNGRMLSKNLTGVNRTAQTPPLPTRIGFGHSLVRVGLSLFRRGGVRGNEMRQPRLAWGLLVILLRRGSGFMHTAIFLHYLARMLHRPLGRKIKGKSAANAPTPTPAPAPATTPSRVRSSYTPPRTRTHPRHRLAHAVNVRCHTPARTAASTGDGAMRAHAHDAGTSSPRAADTAPAQARKRTRPTEAYHGFGLRDFGGVVRESSCAKLEFAFNWIRHAGGEGLLGPNPARMRAVQLEGNTYNLRWEGGNYVGLGMNLQEYQQWKAHMMDFEKPWLKS